MGFPSTTTLVFVGSMVVIALAVAYGRHRQQKRAAVLANARERLAKKVRGLGWNVIPGPMSPPQLGFSELEKKGGGQEVRFYVFAPGSEDAAFEHRYVVQRGGSVPHSQEVKHSCALLRLPFAARRLKIDTDMALMKRNVIEIESEHFNWAYWVTCRDERFAVTVLDYAFVDAMLQPGVVDQIISLEMIGPWMLITVPGRPCEQLGYVLEAGQRLRDCLPAVLSSMYPVPPAMQAHLTPPHLTPPHLAATGLAGSTETATSTPP